MALIEIIKPEDATGEVAQVYAKIKELRGEIPASAQIWSVSPKLLMQQLDFASYYMNHETLSAPLLACLRMLVSSQVSCKYCVDYNSAMLVNLFGWSVSDVGYLKAQGQSPKLSDKENAMLSFVVAAVKKCSKADESELNDLRKMGWKDSDILDALQHGARMSAIDIIFNTFDLEGGDK